MRAATTVRTSANDVDRRLKELSLSRESILAIRDAARAAAATGSSPLFPSNGSGQLSYQFGTRELRYECLQHGWVIDRTYGTQGVRFPGLAKLALYQNVDVACNLAKPPHPRSKKGAGSERLAQMEAFELFEDAAPTTFEEGPVGVEVWYVMVSEDGAVEVTNAKVRGGEFSELIERLFVHDNKEFSVDSPAESWDAPYMADVSISRK